MTEQSMSFFIFPINCFLISLIFIFKLYYSIRILLSWIILLKLKSNLLSTNILFHISRKFKNTTKKIIIPNIQWAYSELNICELARLLWAYAQFHIFPVMLLRNIFEHAQWAYDILQHKLSSLSMLISILKSTLISTLIEHIYWVHLWAQ